MSQYEELDRRIVARVGHNKGLTFALLYRAEVFCEARRLGELTGRQPYRIADGRLQALRSAGLIRFVKSVGWVGQSTKVKP